jgi:hypothetical protein
MTRTRRARKPIIRFGKRRAKKDIRNLMLASVLKAPPAPPAEYDFDVQHHGIPTPIFANDTLSDCVIAGRAHQTLRFEEAEQKKLIRITDAEVRREYFKETGGPDSGLVVLDSLNLWRHRGWRVGAKTYKIKAFAQITPTRRMEVKRAIFLDIGVGLGFTLPNSAITQFHAGKSWDVTTGPGSAPNPENGHYVHAPGYTKRGPVCVTWGRKQQMTWAFLAKYCDEAYAIIDSINTAKAKRGLNGKKIDAFLAAL